MKIKKSQEGKIKKYNVGGIIGGAVQGVAGIGQTIYGIGQAKKANAAMNRLLADAPELTLPSAYTEYAQKAMDKSALRAQTEAINRRLATSTDALSKAGGRALLGGLQSQVTAANTAEITAQDAQRQREMQGLQVLGGAQAANQQMREQRFQMQYGQANAAKQAALANIGGGISSAAKGAMAAGTSYDEFKEAKNGMKTKGEFSHDSNPLYLVDKEGNVTGEATGGEYILNPKQAKSISKESKFFRNLLKQKRFK
jgi:hypothetical protein